MIGRILSTKGRDGFRVMSFEGVRSFGGFEGEGAWQSFVDELRGTIDSSKDEVWELVPELSGTME